MNTFLHWGKNSGCTKKVWQLSRKNGRHLKIFISDDLAEIQREAVLWRVKGFIGSAQANAKLLQLAGFSPKKSIRFAARCLVKKSYLA